MSADERKLIVEVLSELDGLAEALGALLPRSEEATLAAHKLEEAGFWANACLARHSDFLGTTTPKEKTDGP